MANERAITSEIPVESAPAPASAGGFRQDTRVNGGSKSILNGCFGVEWAAMEEGILTKANSFSMKGPPVVSLARKVYNNNNHI